MTRVFIAGIFHETHSFSGDTTGLDGFVIHRGQEILNRRGDASQVDGFLSVAEREGWEVVPSAVYTGGASGTVDHAVFEAFWSEVQPVLDKALAEGGWTPFICRCMAPWSPVSAMIRKAN